MSETSSPPPEFQQPEDDDLGHAFRIVLVVQNKDSEENEMDEFNLDNVNTFSEMNKFFDEFDDKIAIPNKENVKYDVGSDGLVVILVDNKDLKSTVAKFIDEYKFSN